MAKLLKQQLIDNLKTLIFVWLIPLVLASSFIIVRNYIKNDITEIGLGLSMFIMIMGLSISFLLVIYKDYDRFFGKQASFYQTLPIKSSSVIISRFLQYLIIGFLIFVVAIIDFVITIQLGGEADLNTWKLIFNQIGLAFNHLKNWNVLFILLSMVTEIICSIMMIIYCINVGSEKIFKSMGIFGPILVYILASIVITLLAILIFTKLPLPSQVGLYIEDDFTFESFLHVTRYIWLFTSLGNIILTIYFTLRSKYSLDRRLTVA